GILAESARLASNFQRWLRSFCDPPPPHSPGAQARTGERQGTVPGRHHRMVGRAARGGCGVPGRPVAGPEAGAGVCGRGPARRHRVLVGPCSAPGRPWRDERVRVLLPDSIPLSVSLPDGVASVVYDVHRPIPVAHRDAEVLVIWRSPADRLAAMPGEL